MYNRERGVALRSYKKVCALLFSNRRLTTNGSNFISEYVHVTLIVMERYRL